MSTFYTIFNGVLLILYQILYHAKKPKSSSAVVTARRVAEALSSTITTEVSWRAAAADTV
jgi:hypothetical protein